MHLPRRQFLRRAAALAGAVAIGRPGPVKGRGAATAAAGGRGGKLTIVRATIQAARGRRLTPVAPNAYAPYRGYEVRQQLLRLSTAQGIEGVGTIAGRPDALADALKPLLGVDPHDLFAWDGDVVREPAERYRELLDRLGGGDTALFDLLGKDLGRPAAALLGTPCREDVVVYDSSLYMEDLLAPAERENLVYLAGPPPADPAEMVARKALWVIGDGRGIRVLKIKIGRARWLGDPARSLERDVAVLKAIRKHVGPDVTLLVDGNDGYGARPLDALAFAQAVAAEKVYAMEEMFSEEKVGRLREVKKGMRAATIATKLADGENQRGGIPPRLLAERCAGPRGEEPLFDINQPDMDQNGFLRILAIARESARHGVAMAPHNFASKMGFYTQVHAGLVVPNWEFSEIDDSAFPGIEAPGIEIRNGRARATGLPGLGIALREEHLEKPALILRA